MLTCWHVQKCAIRKETDCERCVENWNCLIQLIIINAVNNKKLSYCCDSRSYCMQYFNAIHCDRNISTSELKNPFAVSPRIVRIPHTALSACRDGHRHGTAGLSLRGLPWRCRVSLLTNEPCRFDDHGHVLPESIVYTYGVSHFFVSAFCG